MYENHTFSLFVIFKYKQKTEITVRDFFKTQLLQNVFPYPI